METLTHQAIQQIQAKNYGECFLDDSRSRLLLGIGLVDKVMDYHLVKGAIDVPRWGTPSKDVTPF